MRTTLRPEKQLFPYERLHLMKILLNQQRSPDILVSNAGVIIQWAPSSATNADPNCCRYAQSVEVQTQQMQTSVINVAQN
jgi:hypothetical protein